MSVALQIRDVPEAVRDVIAEQAARRGQSMQAYLLAMVQREARIARQVSAFEVTAGRRVPLSDIPTPEDIIREGRDAGFEVDRA